MKTVVKIPINVTIFILGGLIPIFSFSCMEDRTNNKTQKDHSNIIWEYDAEKDSMLFNHKPSDLTPKIAIEKINLRYIDIVNLELVRSSKDTVFVRIFDANNLTQRMGTTGAFGYLAETTYSLTEIPHINFVHFDFKEGDHASPGLYQRTDFDNKL